VVRHTATSVVTIERFIIEQERQHPEATGELSGILYDIALAAKMIASKVRMAGLADILGSAESQNIQGEVQQ
jgi:fructose-1,6-bisphosphatase I